MSSYDSTKQGIVQITAHIMSELMSGIKPRQYLKDGVPLDTKRVNNHFPVIISALEEDGVIELVNFNDSDFKGYRLTYEHQNKGSKFKGDLSRVSMSRDIGVLDIDNRTENALRAAGVNTLAELVTYNPENSSFFSDGKILNLGDKGVKQIESELAVLGLFLRY